jgi:hypothetical protein
MARKSRQLDPRTPLPEDIIPPPRARRAAPAMEFAPPWLGPNRTRRQIDALWLLVAGCLTAGGLFFFGWRGLCVVALTALAAVATWWLTRQVMRLVRPRVQIDSAMHLIVMAMLLGLALPVMRRPSIAVLAGMLLGIACHLVGRTHRLRVHPVALVMVVLWLLPAMLAPHGRGASAESIFQPINAVLQPGSVIVGDLNDASPQISRQTWSMAMRDPQYDAVNRAQPYELLIADQKKMLEPPSILVNMLGSGELARLEELLFGSVPGPIGGTSRALIIVLGLYLMYRRLSWWVTGAIAFIAALAALLVMPVHTADGWTIVIARLLALEPAVAVTYVSYILLASPLAFIALILAPLTAPTSNLGRIVYGTIIGAGLIIAQWTLQSPHATYLGLLVASILSRPLDWLHPRPFTR